MSHERRLIAALVAVCERFASKAGHLAPRDDYEHLGVCSLRRHYVSGERVKDGAGWRITGQTLDGTCAPSCVAYTDALAEARAYLAATESRQTSYLEAGG